MLTTFDAIGTRWEIDTPAPLEDEVLQRIRERIADFDATYSRFRADSIVARIAAAPQGGRFNFPPDAIQLFELYDRLHQATRGAVDPLVGRDLELLGYDASYSLRPASAEALAAARSGDRPAWTSDIAREGRTVVTNRPLVIDLGAAGKGYLVDIVSKMLRACGVREFVVDAGGDIRRQGSEILVVGLEHPFSPGSVIGTVDLKCEAICASAVNRRAWGDGLHHVLNGRTGVPVRDVVATWAVADDAATADGVATALFFVPGGELQESFSFSSVRMFADGRIERSTNFAGELFV